MGTISSELLNFRNSVEGKTDGMNSKCDEIISKVQQASSSSNTAKSGVSNYYKSKNASIILGTFDNLNSEYQKIDSSVSGTLKNLVTEAASLVSDVNELENINKTIEENQQIANANNGDTDESKKRRDSALATVSQREEEFSKLHEEALSKLSQLKSTSDDLGDSSSSTSGSEDTNDNTHKKAKTTNNNNIIENYNDK